MISENCFDSFLLLVFIDAKNGAKIQRNSNMKIECKTKEFSKWHQVECTKKNGITSEYSLLYSIEKNR